jgi:hypothetical protein
MLAAAVGITVARLPSRLAMAWLVIVVAVQMVDLRGAHLERHRISRSEAFHAHRLSLTSPLWERAMPHYRHLVLLPPKQCGVAPVPFEWLAFLAGRHGLTINGGEVARYDTEQVEAYCLSLTDTIARGALEDDRMYVITPSLAESLQAQSSQLLTCLPADDVMICVTERSAVEWLQR